MDLDLFPEPIRSHLRRDFRQGMAEAVMKMMEELMPEPMADERLAEIEAGMSYPDQCGTSRKHPKCYHHGLAEELLAEVRRLRRGGS